MKDQTGPVPGPAHSRRRLLVVADNVRVLEDKQQDGHPQNDKEPKQYTIIVNGREKTVAAKELSFAEVVALAFGDAPGPNEIDTITYRRGRGDKEPASLAPGETVRLKEGMIFNVTRTCRS
jgi:hypothetical protein